jgi:hypothetical protein
MDLVAVYDFFGNYSLPQPGERAIDRALGARAFAAAGLLFSLFCPA